MILRYFLALLVFNLSACASMQHVDVPAAGHIPPGIHHLSEVKLVTMDGDIHEFVVTKINEQGLGGTPGFFEYKDIRELKVKVQKGDKVDFWAVLVGVALIGLLYAGAMAGAQAAGSSRLLGGGG